jgi:hypothetical protein
LIRVKQQMEPSFSKLIRAIFSPGRIPALSRRSLGKTIWPFSSTLIRDSTLQQLDPEEAVLAHPAMVFPAIDIYLLHEIRICSAYSDFSD